MSQNTLSRKMFGAGVSLWCAVLLILLTLTKDCVGTHELKSPAIDFNRHRIVQPKVHHGRTKRQITSTKDKSGAHHSELTVTMELAGEEHHLDLQLNQDLVADGHVIQYQKDGKTVTHRPTKEELELCQYHGKVRGKPASRVALSTCHGVRGVMFDGEKMRYIEPAEGGDIQSRHYVYDQSDLNTNHYCGLADRVNTNASHDPMLMKKHNQERHVKRSTRSYKRHADDVQVRGPYNENELSRYVELVLVADYGEFQANGENIHTVYRQLKDVANIINSIYAPLNIFIALVGVVIWNERNEIQLSEDSGTTLDNFLHYRSSSLVIDIPNDNAHLLTRKQFSRGVVGKAYKSQMCTHKQSGGVNSKHSEVIGLVAATIAHEMGHNFGMEHDTTQDCECPDEKCIMSPSSTSVIPVHWSSCSLQSVALSFSKGMDYCLRNKPKRLFGSPTCGNGFVEPGEQCDCGVRPGAACLACCRAHSCMLRANATCGAGSCCDLQTCRPKAAGTQCRSAERECDLPEYCTGHSEFCPDDVYKMDTTPCGTQHQAYCMRGSCRSHTDQCRLLWGTTGENSHDICYSKYNIMGNRNGNCGYDRRRHVYKACAEADVMCGRLQCRYLNGNSDLNMGFAYNLYNIYISNNGKIIRCHTAEIDLGLSDVDPGMVPDGAKCGDDKMCLGQQCISVEAVRAEMAYPESSECLSNCSGHGVCNSKGHCHCASGFSPPLCALPGVGGSVDSGPAADPAAHRKIMIAMYVIFLGIVPFIVLLFLIYYWRKNLFFWCKRAKKSDVDSVPGKGSHEETVQNEFFTFNISRFHNNTKTKHKPTVNDENTQPSTAKSPENTEQSISYNSMYMTKNISNKKPPQKPCRKFNKDVIQIASEKSNVKPKKPTLLPPLPPKPKVVIQNLGLTSTTNGILNKPQNNSRLRANLSGQNVKVQGFKR